MRIALLHPQCRTQGGAIKMALLTAQSLQKQGHEVTLYTFDYSPECFPELQKGLTIRDRSSGNIKTGLGLDTVDTTPLFSRQKISPLQKISRIIRLAWHVRHVDIIIANNPPMQIVAALAKVFSIKSTKYKVQSTKGRKCTKNTILNFVFCTLHFELSTASTIWWHHHVPWYYSSPDLPAHQVRTRMKSWLERHIILPRIDYLVATSEYVAECLKNYCGREATVMHPVIMNNEQGIMNNAGSSSSFSDAVQRRSENPGQPTIPGKCTSGVDDLDPGSRTAYASLARDDENKSEDEGFNRPITLFTHGRLEPGKGLETLVKIWKGLRDNPGVEATGTPGLLIAGDGSLKSWLIEQGATVVPYYEGLLTDIQMKNEQGIMNNAGSSSSFSDEVQRRSENPGQSTIPLETGMDSTSRPSINSGLGWNDGVKPEVEGRISISDNQGNEQNQLNLSETGASDTLAIYLSTIDAFGMASLEAQIAGLSTIILDRGGAGETVLLDSFGAPVGQLVGTEEEIPQAITYFIQHKSLQKTMSNVNFCHQRDYFSSTRLDADIRSLIGFVG